MISAMSCLKNTCFLKGVVTLATLFVFILISACAEESDYPACGAAKIIYDKATGELVSGPEEILLDEPPYYDPKRLPKEGNELKNIRDGLWRLDQEVTESSVAEPDDIVRILLSLPLRDEEKLNEWLEKVYDPEADEYLNFVSSSCLTYLHSPQPESIGRVKTYLESYNLSVDRIARNRLLIIASGKVSDIQDAFNFELIRVIRVRRPDFATESELKVPDWIVDDIEGLISIQDMPDNPQLPVDDGLVKFVPYAGRVTPKELNKAYGNQQFIDKGMDGRGQAIGIIVGWIARETDLESYFLSLGIEREGSIKWRFTDFPPPIFSNETTVDIQMVGSTAPGSDLLIYVASDNTDFSLTWATNETVGDNKVSVISYSFSHQEVITSWELQQHQSRAAKLAAAQGITFYAASGDSRNVDTPANSPWVTAVGSSYLIMDDNFERSEEIDAWFGGRGRSALFAKPEWQRKIDPEGMRRATVDLSIHAMADMLQDSLYVFTKGDWLMSGGTSLAAPLLAGMTACVNQARGDKGRLGWINRTIYENEEVQATFIDVTDVWMPPNEATPGWDFGTGWGAPNVDKWPEAIP